MPKGKWRSPVEEKILARKLRRLTGRSVDRQVLKREVRRSGGDRVGALLYLITRARSDGD